MGNQKQRWTEEEEGALLAGVSKYGPGKWKNIIKDPDFAPLLTHRSNIDLKDKWRNMCANNGSIERSKRGRVKNPIVRIASFAKSSAPAENVDAIIDHALEIAADGKKDAGFVLCLLSISTRYIAMVYEALSEINDLNGSDLSTILDFIEQRHVVPQNFRRVLSEKLRRLVAQRKLEKVQDNYRIMKGAPPKTKSPTRKPEELKQLQLKNPALVTYDDFEAVLEAATVAAYKIAEAENKSFLAAEAVREAERIGVMAEHTEATLYLIEEIYEQCKKRT
ncbi:unnamed protein product [Linum tenue]|uniref:MYB transcription factor n=1 Tax=Linum tenue TaxID=586396 RepID=A0AAV0PQA7_9ROSI|nr:unnamed protein product [Linum tenue]